MTWKILSRCAYCPVMRLGMLAVVSVSMVACGDVAHVPPNPPTQSSAPSEVQRAPCAKDTTLEARQDPPLPTEPAAAETSATQQVRSANATPNSANGSIELVFTEQPTPCGPYQPFPKSCEPAWRIRIDLMPEQQRPGDYALGPEAALFAYRDAQGKAGGVWETGAACQNLGGAVVGTLKIVAIDAEGISGVLSGTGDADGPFRARRCSACKGTGQACTNNTECCNDFCHAGRCQP